MAHVPPLVCPVCSTGRGGCLPPSNCTRSILPSAASSTLKLPLSAPVVIAAFTTLCHRLLTAVAEKALVFLDLFAHVEKPGEAWATRHPDTAIYSIPNTLTLQFIATNAHSLQLTLPSSSRNHTLSSTTPHRHRRNKRREKPQRPNKVKRSLNRLHMDASAGTSAPPPANRSRRTRQILRRAHPSPMRPLDPMLSSSAPQKLFSAVGKALDLVPYRWRGNR